MEKSLVISEKDFRGLMDIVTDPRVFKLLNDAYEKMERGEYPERYADTADVEYSDAVVVHDLCPRVADAMAIQLRVDDAPESKVSERAKVEIWDWLHGFYPDLHLFLHDDEY